MKNAETSVAMGTDKAGHVLATGAEVLCAADNSCLMHIRGQLDRGHSGVRTLHFAEILAATREDPLDTGTPIGEVSAPTVAAGTRS